MKHRWILVTALFLSACAQPTQTQNNPVASKPAAPMPTCTPPILPTSTVTPLPQPTSTPEPLPPAPISPKNLADLTQVYNISLADIRRVHFSQDGSQIAAATGNQENFGAFTFASPSGEPLYTYQPYDGIVWDLDISKDDLWMATAANSADGQGIAVWNLVNQTLDQKIGQPAQPDCVAFSPDGSVLAAGGLTTWPDGEIWLYEAATWTPLLNMEAPGQNILALEYSPDGSMLVSAGTDGIIRIWRSRDGSLLHTLDYAPQASRITFSPGGELLASTFCTDFDSGGCTTGGVVVWRTADWSILQVFEDLAQDVIFSPDGQLMITASGYHDPLIRFRRTIDWSEIYTISDNAQALAMNRLGNQLVVANQSGIQVWMVKPQPVQ
ncbi:hypothetical protein ADN00_05840 [Ornatilinea apprima]|uniref:Uncharacterized protein n=2 Tax=Ornatilinea apprima TaxID=1134406 RepID=A0A0P6Y0A7_9CHLR|nr:hypothetical protein ADN00_05840 [Ornatilinea apprima]